jgi:hypothetical protein
MSFPFVKINKQTNKSTKKKKTPPQKTRGLAEEQNHLSKKEIPVPLQPPEIRKWLAYSGTCVQLVKEFQLYYFLMKLKFRNCMIIIMFGHLL